MISLSALTFMRLMLYYSDVGIRLTGSNVTFAGRVEVLSYGVWGRIDGSSSWDRTEAEVVCRQLGFPDVVTALKYSPFGEGSGPVLMSNVRCIGNEKTLKQCQYNDWLKINVYQNREAGVICKTPEINTDVRDISIRLQGSLIPNAGRVEVLYAGIWGAISGTNWDINDATVVCRQLGYQAGTALANGVYGPVSGPVWITNLQCSGSEANLMSCSHDGIGNKPETQNRWNIAGVECKNLSHANGMLVRLRGSLSPNMGRVEVYYAGIWGLIDSSKWDIKDATVVCRQLGYTTALLAGRRLFCSITLPFFFQNFGCYGNESALDQCAWDFASPFASYSFCANVVCNDGAAESGFDVQLTSSAVRHAGRIELRIHGIWGTLYNFYSSSKVTFGGVICRQLNFSDSILAVCRAVFGPGTGPQWYKTRDIRCLGDERNLQNCTHYSQPKLTIYSHKYDLSVICKPSAAQIGDFKLRLTGSSLSFAGIIEVMYYGVWGGVLGRYIDINEGHVVCRQLGYPGAHKIFKKAAFGRLKGPFWIWRMHCNGDELKISDCAITTWDNIRHERRQIYYQEERPDYAAGVLCREADFNPSQMLNVRLSGAPISNAGRVEVFYAGVWGTLDRWGRDINAAHVVCRQLGYPASLSSGHNNQFSGSNTGPKWFGNLRCFGNETNLGECTKDVSGYLYSGSRAATVLCKLPYQTGIPSKCSEVKCQHHGTCIDTGGGAICNCTEGFTGIHCEKSISNPCQSSPCVNGGKCFSNGDSYICLCPDGHSRHLCAERTTIDEPSLTQTGSATSKTTFVIILSILASLVFLLIAAVVYLIFQNRRLSKPKPKEQQATSGNITFRGDREETQNGNEINLGTGTNKTLLPTRDNTNPLYELVPSIEETVTSRPLPPVPPQNKAARMNPKAARKKANRSNGDVKPRGAAEGPKRTTREAEMHYMALSNGNKTTVSPNISADGATNPNEYMSLSPNRDKDISHS